MGTNYYRKNDDGAEVHVGKAVVGPSHVRCFLWAEPRYLVEAYCQVHRDDEVIVLPEPMTGEQFLKFLQTVNDHDYTLVGTEFS